MSTSAERPDVLVDTSAAVAFVLSDHDHHESTYASLRSRRLGLAGHAAFETYSVLTRLPPPARCSPSSAVELISTNFPATMHLSDHVARSLLDHASRLAIAGGAVYDALVAAAALEFGLPLATRESSGGPHVFARSRSTSSGSTDP